MSGPVRGGDAGLELARARREWERQPKTSCPVCGHWDSQVVGGHWDAATDAYVRDRKCRSVTCRARFQTEETLRVRRPDLSGHKMLCVPAEVTRLR